MKPMVEFPDNQHVPNAHGVTAAGALAAAFDALTTLEKQWNGHTFMSLPAYGRHGERCGGEGNDRACSCAFNQSRGNFLRSREKAEAALRLLRGSP